MRRAFGSRRLLSSQTFFLRPAAHWVKCQMNKGSQPASMLISMFISMFIWRWWRGDYRGRGVLVLVRRWVGLVV